MRLRMRSAGVRTRPREASETVAGEAVDAELHVGAPRFKDYFGALSEDACEMLLVAQSDENPEDHNNEGHDQALRRHKCMEGDDVHDHRTDNAEGERDVAVDQEYARRESPGREKTTYWVTGAAMAATKLAAGPGGGAPGMKCRKPLRPKTKKMYAEQVARDGGCDFHGVSVEADYSAEGKAGESDAMVDAEVRAWDNARLRSEDVIGMTLKTGTAKQKAAQRVVSARKVTRHSRAHAAVKRNLKSALGPTVAERMALGKALRGKVSRGAQGEVEAGGRTGTIRWRCCTNRTRGRVAALLPIRYGRMRQSPFAFYRGAAMIMAAGPWRRRRVRNYECRRAAIATC